MFARIRIFQWGSNVETCELAFLCISNMFALSVTKTVLTIFDCKMQLPNDNAASKYSNIGGNFLWLLIHIITND